MSRRKSRQAVVQILYRDEFHKDSLKKKETDQENFFLKDLNKEDKKFALELLKNIQSRKEELDEVITKHSQNWKMKRISLVDASIMRMAIFEILFSSNVPGAVALNEALELAKQFGEKESVSFINGILDQVLKSAKNGL